MRWKNCASVAELWPAYRRLGVGTGPPRGGRGLPGRAGRPRPRSWSWAPRAKRPTISAARRRRRAAPPSGCTASPSPSSPRASRRATLAARGATPATALAADALATRALSSSSRDGALRHLAPVVGEPGSAARAGRDPGRAARGGRLGLRCLAALERAPRRGLGELGRRYDALLEEGGLADRAALLAVATVASRRRPGGLPAAPVLLLDVPITTAAERAFVEALVTRAPEVLATLPAGDSRTESLLPASLAAAIERRETPGTDALARVGRNLFAADADAGPADDSVRFFSAPGEGREAVEVARRILEEAARGVPFDEMAIVVRAPESYWGPIEQALERATVPAWFSRGTRRPDHRPRLPRVARLRRGRSVGPQLCGNLSLGQVPRRDAAGRPIRRRRPS